MELGSVSGVQFGDKMLTEGTDYTVEENVITISAKVLERLELGNYKITILTTDGNQPTVFSERD